MTDDGRRRKRGDRHAVVPDTEFESYYDRPILKEPVWKPEVPWYFFTGGLAGAAALLAAAARNRGDDDLAASARTVAAVAAVVSPPLLIKDLGVPSRFYNMLRVFKITSPLSVGSWILAAFAPAAVGSAVLHHTGRLRRTRSALDAVTVALGPLMTTYTAALVANTAIPVWQQARRELPAVFAASAAASAGAATTLVTTSDETALARRVAVAGAVAELGVSTLMDRNLGELAEPYHQGQAGRLERAAKLLTGSGAAVLALSRGSRGVDRLGSLLVLGGAASKRWAVFEAGFQSARDPKYVVVPQRRRLAARAEEAQRPGR